MDQDKIGKLIAKLRKEKGLTQRELGDKVGVGFKAVSKWERGITCPDISIINELSKILGITSDELLTGELSDEHKNTNKEIGKNNKFSKKIIIFIVLIVVLGLFVFLIYKINNNKMEIYELATVSNDYYVEGKVIFKKNTMAIYINKFVFNDKNFRDSMVKNYKYRIDSGDNILLIYGYLLSIDELTTLISINDIIEKFSVNYENTIDVDKKELINNGLVLGMSFLDNDNNVLEKNIFLILKKSK